jgi:putative transposase
MGKHPNPKPPLHPVRKTDRLHRGRVSASGALYFVTLVTAGRLPWLRETASAKAALAVLQAWQAESDGAILAATIMPDHVHVLFRLGEKLNAGRCVARWKTQIKKQSGFAGEWQRDFWEHRVRENERWEDYGFYMFLNPYRAGLVGAGETWPWWWVPKVGDGEPGAVELHPYDGHDGRATNQPLLRPGQARISHFAFLEMLDARGAPPSDWLALPAAKFQGLALGE